MENISEAPAVKWTDITVVREDILIIKNKNLLSHADGDGVCYRKRCVTGQRQMNGEGLEDVLRR